MTMGPLGRIVEHSNWANAELIRSCSSLTAERMDAKPRSPRERTIRQVLAHLVESQVGYASMLSSERRTGPDPAASLEDLARAAAASGEGLQAIADGEVVVAWESDLRTSDGYFVKPWTVFVQAINHAGDHRRQVCELLRALGVEPPRLDGWGFGEATGAVLKAGDGRK